MKLKIPPPAVFVITAILIYFSPVVGTFEAPFLVASFLIIAAIGLDMLSLWHFFKAKTTINPLNPKQTTALITTGLYRLSRNPMYLSLSLYLLSLALVLGNALAFLWVAVFILLINKLQIEPEEAILEAKFGQDYLEYKAKVRRWI
ncbi:hypothetical protein A4G20_09585 [Pasteurellaceae bacterium RH1A]|nr:hypothetical protein A4G20_09585 [Pasteurellaceae bacterium RH1A]